MSQRIKLIEFLNSHRANFMLLQSKDEFSRCHYSLSQLSRYSGFTGTSGEAVMARNGKIILFVDPRYHIQADKEKKKDVTVVKLAMSDKFQDALGAYVGKSDTLLISSQHTMREEFEKLGRAFNLQEAKYPDIIEDAPQNEEIFAVKNKTASKIAQVQAFIKSKKARGMLITNLEDIAFLSGLRSLKSPYRATFRAKMYISKDEAVLYCSAPLKLKALKTMPLNQYLPPEGKTLIMPKVISQWDYSLLESPVALCENPVAKMAAIKTKSEIARLKGCYARLDLALKGFKEQLKEGLSELELKNILENQILKCGAVGLSFKTILAIGQNSASIHYCNYDENKKLKNSDIILADCGSYCQEGIATDITRVFAFGEPSIEQKRIYTLVLKAFLNAYHSALNTGFELDALARSILKNDEGFKFPHALGHGIGIAVHQSPPCISPSDELKVPLQEGNTFTIEPGLYKEGFFGIRLENCVYIEKTRTGKLVKKSFSKFPFETTLIEEKMLTGEEKKWLKKWQEKA